MREKRFHILALKWQKLENSTAAIDEVRSLGGTASSQVIVMHDANWQSRSHTQRREGEACGEILQSFP